MAKNVRVEALETGYIAHDYYIVGGTYSVDADRVKKYARWFKELSSAPAKQPEVVVEEDEESEEPVADVRERRLS